MNKKNFVGMWKKMFLVVLLVVGTLTAVVANTEIVEAKTRTAASKKTKKVTKKKSTKKSKKKSKKKAAKKVKKTKKAQAAKKSAAKKNGKVKKYTVKKDDVTKKTAIAGASKVNTIHTPVGGNLTESCGSKTDHAYRINGTTVVGHYEPEMAEELTRLVNEYRVKMGRCTTQESAVLIQAAGIRAVETTVTFSHTRPNGQSNFTVSPFVSGENLFSGRTDTKTMLERWIASDSHNEVMLSHDFRAIGISIFAKQTVVYGKTMYVYYATLVFGR